MTNTRVLIVEDDPDFQLLMKTQLRMKQFDISWAVDGIQAISVAREGKPDVILMDLGLPGGSGLLALERLKANRLLAQIPIIIVTAQDPNDAEAKSVQLGAAGFLQKPVNIDALVAMIRRVLGQHTA
jgi:DNA-binding response OmpR family regulator